MHRWLVGPTDSKDAGNTESRGWAHGKAKAGGLPPQSGAAQWQLVDHATKPWREATLQVLVLSAEEIAAERAAAAAAEAAAEADEKARQARVQAARQAAAAKLEQDTRLREASGNIFTAVSDEAI